MLRGAYICKSFGLTEVLCIPKVHNLVSNQRG